jgi:hypothetical protein
MGAYYMRTVKDVLIAVRESWTEGGAGLSAKTALLKHREREFRLLLFYGVLAVASLGVATWLLVTNGIQAAKTFVGIAGLGGAGCLGFLLQAWRDWSRTDLLLILIEDAPKAQITTLIDKLVRQL